jgi:hypothetical protein
MQANSGEQECSVRGVMLEWWSNMPFLGHGIPGGLPVNREDP